MGDKTNNVIIILGFLGYLERTYPFGIRVGEGPPFAIVELVD